jgi:hypothetical protein
MDNLVRKKAPKMQLSPAQKAFHRLQKKIENLQVSLKTTEEQLDQSLLFYYEKIQPLEKRIVTHLTECIKLLYHHLKNPTSLSKKEHKLLKELISYKINEIFSITMFKEIDPEIRLIFKELEGIDYEEAASKDLDHLRAEMENMFKEEGIEIDLSKINLFDDEHDLNHKLFEAMGEAHAKRLENESAIPPKEKTKRELEKEKKAQELENLQKKGIGTIYKQLVKVLHPDLEQNPAIKKEKEELMKKLTVAYENNDLITLLSLEMEWINSSDKKGMNEPQKNDEQLKIYNSILKDQIEMLQEGIHSLFLYPKYLPIQKYFSDETYPPMFLMKLRQIEAQEEANHYQFTADQLRSQDALKTLRSILKAFSS